MSAKLMFYFSVVCFLSVVGLFAYDYAKNSGNVLDRIKQSFSNSLTVFWSRALVLLSALSGVFLDTLADPNTQELVRSWLKPEYVVPALIFIGFITEAARRRSIDKDVE